MTAAELIEELKQYPPETPVLAIGCSGFDCDCEEDSDVYVDDSSDTKGAIVIRC